MKHMTADDLKAFMERLDIMKQWALGESAHACAARFNDAGEQILSSSGSDAAESIAPFAAVKVPKPTLEEIEQALQRISQRRYGLCSICERAIARERLLVEPAAIRCHACHVNLAD